MRDVILDTETVLSNPELARYGFRSSGPYYGYPLAESVPAASTPANVISFCEAAARLKRK